MTARSAAMQAVLRLSLQVGGPRLWDLVRGGRIKILMYHGVPTRQTFAGIVNHYGYNVPVALFEQHADYLRKSCNVVSIRDVLAGRNLSRRRTNVVLTFDDGYQNNFTNAFRVLAERNLPAVYALPTAFVVDGEPLWNDVIEHMVDRSTIERATIPLPDGEHAFDLRDPAERLRLYAFLLRQCVRADMAHRALVTERARAALAVPATAADVLEDEDYRPLTKDQVQTMAESGLAEIASHSVHHYLLSTVSREEKRAELRDSRAAIEEIAGRPCRVFCVPGGSYDGEVLDEAFGAGYECVLTSDQGPAAPGSRVLNRYGIFRHHDLPRFADLVHGPVQSAIAAARGRLRSARNGKRR